MNAKFETAIRLIDEANSRDPNLESWQGDDYPRELLYAQRMSRWLEKLEPAADELQRIAARAQHLCRWQVPRDSYPKTRAGYRAWRSGLYVFHAEKCGELMKAADYDDQSIARVKKMIAKQGLKTDPDTQLIEDVACLVFIEHYFLAFSNDYPEEKLVSIVRKTWNKMSDRAREAAFALNLPETARTIIGKALAP